MSIFTTSGSQLYIGPVNANLALGAVAYAALTPWVEVEEIENLGDFGDESADVTFSSIKDARVRHLKGARDAGSLALTCARDHLDPGQIALRAAQATKFNYAFKVVAADNADDNDTKSIFYFSGPVRSARNNFGNNNNVTKTNFMVGISSPIIEVPGTVVA
jgi:hypothetical protein